MGSYVHKPVRWDKEASLLWKAGLREPALAKSLATLEQMAEPDADAFIHADTGNLMRAKLFGTLALQEKDKAVADRYGQPKLRRRKPGKKKQIIAFTLFGSGPRYLRGALDNVLVARDLYPGWMCRFYVDDSVDETFLKVLEEEGSEVILDDSGN